MKELVEIRFNDNRILLKDNLVKSPILPRVVNELERDIVIMGECVIEGAVYARTFEIQTGPLTVKGAAFADREIHVNTDARGRIVFEKAIASASSIVSLSPSCSLLLLGDVCAKTVKLRNTYISANIFADEVTLENCVVIGGVFGTRSVEIHNCIVGTFNSPSVRLSKKNYLLFPSAFSVEKAGCLPGTELDNLTLADLGALMRGTEPVAHSGRIPMSMEQDEVKSVLTTEGEQQILRSYSVVGKVLAADLIDYDKLQNHFLISCASLNSQLMRTYDLGLDKAGKAVEMTPDRIASFFFEILDGKVEVPLMSGSIDIRSILKGDALAMAHGTAGQIAADMLNGTVGPDVKTDAGPVQSLEQNLAAEGSPLPVSVEASTCRYCGVALELGSKFCDSCGKPQEG